MYQVAIFALVMEASNHVRFEEIRICACSNGVRFAQHAVNACYHLQILLSSLPLVGFASDHGHHSSNVQPFGFAVTGS